jgi:hypothetical protein
MRIHARELLGNQLFIYLLEMGGQMPKPSAAASDQKREGMDNA